MSGAWQQWRVPPDAVTLRPGTVDLWRIWLPGLRGLLQDLLAMLDAAEQRQHAAFRFDHLRERYAVRHGAMRSILAHYLGMPSPRQVDFATGLNGKPRLLNAAAPLPFNLTDSGDLAVLAVSAAGEVGVDVEEEQADRPPLEILPQLAPMERDAITSHPPQERSSALYRTWVRKEAYLKARGDGLSLDLAGFCVPVDPRAGSFPAVRSCSASRAPGTWWGTDFVPGPGWAGSVVTSARPSGVRYWDATEQWVRQRMFATHRADFA